MKNELEQKIEAILFYKAEPVSEKDLADILDTDMGNIIKALENLSERLADRGVRLVRHDNQVLLATAPEWHDLIETILREERQKELGRAGIETLAIVAYKGPLSKKEIEYIRGVNCDYILRNLLMRGLIEKQNSETDERVVLYTVTADTVLSLGLSHISDLPEYESIRRTLQAKEEDKRTDEHEYGE